jgi:uncharacterized protein (DUF4415 family)
MPAKRGGTTRHKPANKPSVRSVREKATRTDWKRVDATTDTDVSRHIREDGGYEFTDEMLASAVWQVPPVKQPISLRIDPDVLAFFRKTGKGYQSRMNAVLRAYMMRAKAPR